MVDECGKVRKAYMADIWEQWYFHVIVVVLQPIVMRRLFAQSLGSVPGRGPHSGKKHIEKLIRAGKAARNFMKMDIRHFYDSIQISIVMRELRRDIADEWFLHCIERIYARSRKGIMIGLYISPWLANYVLIRIDEIIGAHAGMDETRFMDDIVVFAASKRELARLLSEVKKGLSGLRLKAKRNHAIAKFDYVTKRTDGRGRPVRMGRPLDFMGFVFFRDRTVIRKRIMLRCCATARRLSRAKESGRGYFARDVRRLLSLMGWFKHTDSYGCYLDRIKPFIDIRKAKRIVSRLDKSRRMDSKAARWDDMKAAA